MSQVRDLRQWGMKKYGKNAAYRKEVDSVVKFYEDWLNKNYSKDRNWRDDFNADNY